jgi:hypothetical protein
MANMESLIEAGTIAAMILTLILAWVAFTGGKPPYRDEVLKPRRGFPRFSLAMFLYFVAAAAIYLRVDIATAGMPFNNPAGGLAIWSLIGGGIALHLWQRSRQARM